jgi:tripartite-type tricarboxylate transporter receptor subunit TctC
VLTAGLSAGLLIAGAAPLSGAAFAADYPTKPIELIVPYAAGGGTDLVARAFADAAKKHLPQPIGVVNKTGGGGAVGLTEIMAARPDGYPGKVRIGNSGTGAIWHLAAEALAEKTGTTFNHAPFDGANPAVTSLLGGHIEAVPVSPAEVSSQLAAGQLRMPAVMADQRQKAFPDVPTLKEKGIDLTVATWRGIVVPKKTPAAVVETLRTASKAAAED